MLQIQDTLVSLDVLEQRFCCDSAHCKGACCVEGDSGAPLELEEVTLIEQCLPTIWGDLSEKAQRIIEQQGVAYADSEGELVTSIVDGKNCVFTRYDENGVCQCAFEIAAREGRINFLKPVSCHLYPIRVKQYPGYKAVNYQAWSICSGARRRGNQLDLPVYVFLKEPLIRKFGEDWYETLSQAAHLFEANKAQRLDYPR